MAKPPLYLLQRLRALRGDAFVSYPYGSLNYKRVERTLTIPRSQGPGDFLSVDGEHYTTKLLEQHITGGDAQYVEIYQKYETIPGPHFVDVNTDESGLPMIVSKRHILSSSTDYTPGEIVPPSMNIVQIDIYTDGSTEYARVQVDRAHTLSPRMWVKLDGTGLMDGNYRIAAVPFEDQFLILGEVPDPGSSTTGTAQGINRITREIRSTDNLNISIVIDSCFEGQDVTAHNEIDVPCFKNHSLPAYLRQATAFGDGSRSFSSTVGTVYESSVSMSGTANVSLDIEEGYSGPFKAHRSKLYFMGPPPDDFGDATIKPTIIKTSSGTVMVTGGAISFRDATNGSSASNSWSMSGSARAVRVSNVLTGDTPGILDPGLSIFHVNSISVSSGGLVTIATTAAHGFAVGDFVKFDSTNSTPNIDFGYRVVEVPSSTSLKIQESRVTGTGNTGNMQSAQRANVNISIPLSYPTKFTAGDIIRVMNEPEKLKAGGVWVLYYWKLIVPYTSGANPP